MFQDNTIESVKRDPSIALPWIACITLNDGDKNKCLDQAGSIAVDMATVGAVLMLLAVSLTQGQPSLLVLVPWID